MCFVMSTGKLAGMKGQLGLSSDCHYWYRGEYFSGVVQSKQEELPFHMNVCFLGGYAVGGNKRIQERQDECCGDCPIMLINNKLELA